MMGTDLGLPPPPPSGQGPWEASNGPIFCHGNCFCRSPLSSVGLSSENQLSPDKSAAQKEPAPLNC